MSKTKPRAVSVRLNGPTLLTIARMILAILFLIFVMLPEIWAKITALVLFIVASITDLIDGKWARKNKQVTDLGAFLDPLADKTLVNLAFLALSVQAVIPVWVFAIILVRDFAVDGMRMMSARNSITISASIYGKLKTTIQMVALVILLLGTIILSDAINILGTILLYLALALTIISGLDYLKKGWKQLKG